jgi:hypothetical protein
VTGWYDSDCVFHAAYDALMPKGNIIDNEIVEYITDTNAFLQDTYKNIVAVEITSVVLPIDAFRNCSHAAIAGEVSNTYTGDGHTFHLNAPYLLLNIDEFHNVCDGSNDALRKSFCKMHYDKHYKCPNGRGYVIMKQSQGEVKEFFPTALSTLPTMTLSISRPNGELVSTARDGTGVHMVQFEASNRFYLKVVTSTFFDKNEFVVGDQVQIRNYHAYRLSMTQSPALISDINRFINRDEGHEVVGVGDANDSGYYRAMYIRAKGEFDNLAGTFNVNDDMTAEITLFNDNYAYDECSNAQNGNIINNSLQFTVSMVIRTMDPFDANIVSTRV